MSNSYAVNLRCADKACGKEYEKKDFYVCEYCFGPLEVNYDYKKIKKDLTIEKILSREKNLWRYKELLPLDSEPTVGLHSGFTPLIKADNLAKKLGVDELYINFIQKLPQVMVNFQECLGALPIKKVVKIHLCLTHQ